MIIEYLLHNKPENLIIKYIHFASIHAHILKNLIKLKIF